MFPSSDQAQIEFLSKRAALSVIARVWTRMGMGLPVGWDPSPFPQCRQQLIRQDARSGTLRLISASEKGRADAVPDRHALYGYEQRCNEALDTVV